MSAPTQNDETRVLSCMQPTGDVHLGNYLGALKNWVRGQHHCDAFHGIVDLHALTFADEPGVVGQATLELAAMLFAVGLDPGNVDARIELARCYAVRGMMTEAEHEFRIAAKLAPDRDEIKQELELLRNPR